MDIFYQVKIIERLSQNSFLTKEKGQIKKYFQNLDEMSKAVLSEFQTLASAKIAKNNFFNLAIPGGKTPKLFFSMLAKEENLRWDKIRIFWTDERFVPESNENNNYSIAKKNLLEKINIPTQNIFKIETNLPSAKDSASDYDRKLKKIFFDNIASFDLILAGMGADGHFASLFPNSQALYESAKFAIAVPPPISSEPKIERISLTIPVFNLAKKIIFLVQKSKEKILDKSFFLSKNPSFPLSFLDENLDLEFFIADEN